MSCDDALSVARLCQTCRRVHTEATEAAVEMARARHLLLLNTAAPPPTATNVTPRFPKTMLPPTLVRDALLRLRLTLELNCMTVHDDTPTVECEARLRLAFAVLAGVHATGGERSVALHALLLLGRWAESPGGELGRALRTRPFGVAFATKLIVALAAAKAPQGAMQDAFRRLRDEGLVVGGAADNGLVIPQLQSALNQR